MIPLPQDGSWVQRNQGDVVGDLQGTFNVDLTKVLGKTRVTRMLQTTTQITNTDLSSYPVGFRVFDSGTKIWTVAGSKIHHSGTGVASSPFIVDATVGSATDCDSTLSDIEIFNDNLYVTANSKLYKRSAGGNWSSTSFSGGGPWMMASFKGRLYFTVSAVNQIFSTADGSTIVTPNGYANTTSYSLYFDNVIRPTFIRASLNRLWIGSISQSGKGYVYEWDGTTPSFTAAYRLESQGALSCVIQDDVPVITDTNGRIMKFSNGTFVEIARLPIENKLLLNANSSTNNRFIHPNGMTLINSKINILINNVIEDNGSTVTEFCPSGIWEYDDVIFNPYTGASTGAGLYHKYSFSYTPINTNTVTDYGQNRLSGVGALSDMKLTNTAVNATGNILAGGTVYTDASNTNVGIFTNDTFDATSGTTGQYNTLGAGYLVTEKQFARDEKGNPSIQNMWNDIYTQYRKLLTAASKITVKYRTVDIQSTEMSITWTSTTTFVTSTNLTGFEGYEVEVLQGTGAGMCSHITKITAAGSNYEITLDETVTGANGTAKARVQKWKKVSSISQNSATYDQAGMGDLSNWAQFKIFMMFSQKDELERILINNQNTLPIH